jgi:ribosomal protein S14
MHTDRDSYLRQRVRKQNFIRLEHFRRVCTAYTLVWRILLRSLLEDSSLTVRQRTWAKRRHAVLSRMTATTRHNTRCRVSGRARQAFRDTQLARMHFRQYMSEGRLQNYRLGRR